MDKQILTLSFFKSVFCKLFCFVIHGPKSIFRKCLFFVSKRIVNLTVPSTIYKIQGFENEVPFRVINLKNGKYSDLKRKYLLNLNYP